MAIIRNDICCIGSECTVNKFIVIGVSMDQAKPECRIDEFHVITLEQ